jgi:hypothetical protein
MKFNSNEIINLSQDLLVKNNITNNYDYEWLDIVGIPQRPQNLIAPLFFGTYSDGLDGWHNSFDRRPILQKLIDEKGWHIITEEGTNLQGQHLVVSSLYKLAEILYNLSREKSNPFVIGVTGSVAKTTSVAFLEHLLKTAGYKVTRFWSNRLTPLLVQTHYVNRVNADTEFIVMEYSAFLFDHVKVLSSILPPNISFLTNIYNQHIRKDLFKDKNEIFLSKIQIKPDTGKGFINSEILSDLSLSTPNGWNEFSIETDFSRSNPLLPPTRRTAEFYTIGKIVSSEIGVTVDTFEKAFATFTPQENRIPSYSFTEGSLFFDSEAPHGSRLWSWFETVDNSLPILFVDTIDFGNDEVDTYKDLLYSIFNSPTTYVLDNNQNRANIPVNANFIKENKFRDLLIKHLSKSKYVVYHKTIKGKIPGFQPSEYLKSTWGLNPQNNVVAKNAG